MLKLLETVARFVTSLAAERKETTIFADEWRAADKDKTETSTGRITSHRQLQNIISCCSGLRTVRRPVDRDTS